MNRPPLFRLLLFVLYAATLVATLWLAFSGAPYYRLPVIERPHHPLHELWKPSGLLGHGIGILGTAMMVLMLAYIPRKRLAVMQTWGDIRLWLDIHIWLGITGTLLVCFHTAFKVGGIVSVAFWSMVAVALSGVLGRYLYLQIPRGIDGHELDRQELEQALVDQLADLPDGQALLARTASSEEGGLWQWIRQDLGAFWRLRGFEQELRASGHTPEQAKRLRRVLGKAQVLRRRIRRLERVRALLHHWHVIHRPFAVVMYLILVIHVGVALLFGFTWL